MNYRAVYQVLVNAVSDGILKEPFGESAFKSACPGFREGTYRAFLWKYSQNGQGVDQESRLLAKVAPGKFELLRPFMFDA